MSKEGEDGARRASVILRKQLHVQSIWF